MTFVLMAIGLLVAAAGFVTIGFGIPINAFSLGNTLIIAGTIAVTSGLILIALAVVNGHLRRIAEALKSKPLQITRPAEIAAAPVFSAPVAAEIATPRAPVPPQPKPEPAPAAVAEVQPAEPAFSAATATAEAPGPLDWLRAKSKPGAASSVEPPVVEIPDEAPLSPKPPQRPAMPPPVEPALEPRAWSPGRPGSVEPRVMPPLPRATPQPEPQKERERFDLVWPDRGAPSQPTAELTKREPALDMPLPPIPARPRDSRTTERRYEPAAPKPSAERERGPAILKSGVIDGMPYTLYADGSIEADLPTGTVKFASVDALRAHLEKQS